MRIVIDLSNIAYICFYGLGYTNDESCIYDKDEFVRNCLNKIEKIKYLTEANEVVFAKDNLTIRKELDDSYKANRKNLIFPIKEDLLHELLANSYTVYEANNKEADDVMATLLARDIVDCIVSTDQDLLQAVKKEKQIFNPIKMNFLDKEKFIEKYNGLNEYHKILFYKSFFGDSADNIKKAGERLPRKKIVESVNKFDTLDKIVKDLKDKPFFDKINLDDLYLNYELVKLDLNCDIRILNNA